ESLRRLGLEDAIFLPTWVGVRADRVLLPDFLALDRIHRSEVLAELHRLFVPDPVPSPRRRVYVSRSKARFRKITNEPALMGLLGRFGFEAVVAEDLDFNEQVRLFSRCSVLLSNHGAGLANLLFLPKGAWVIECRKDQNGMLSNGKREAAARYNTYYHASDALGLRYGYLACPSPEPDRSCYQADITVDLERLERLLTDAGLAL
ncbi:MAG: glycosyltransferase family 61 protein, partial [bacterium]